MAHEDHRPAGRVDVIPIPPPDRNLPDTPDTAIGAQPRRPRKTWPMSILTSRRFWFIMSLVAVIAAVITIPWVMWAGEPELALRMAIVDKTSGFADRREHRGLYWLLGHNKFTEPRDGEDRHYYDFREDYYGFHPLVPPEEWEESPSVVENWEDFDPGYWTADTFDTESLMDRDVLYLADCYGVYSGDYIQTETGLVYVENWDKIFGGMTEEEVEAAEWFAGEGRLIIAEFNCFASPTPEDLRYRMEDLLGVSWTKWVGRYFVDFTDMTDIPHWLALRYEEDHGRPWDLENSGYILCRHDSEEYIILEDEYDVTTEGLMLYPLEPYTENDVMHGVRDCTFNYWFDIISIHPGTEILATYKLNLTQDGINKLKVYGISPVFPAVTRVRDGYTAYYMAGDMVDFSKAMGPYGTHLTMYINRRHYSQPIRGGHGYFFWHAYYPFISNVLREECRSLTGLPEDVYLFESEESPLPDWLLPQRPTMEEMVVTNPVAEEEAKESISTEFSGV